MRNLNHNLIIALGLAILSGTGIAGECSEICKIECRDFYQNEGSAQKPNSPALEQCMRTCEVDKCD